jgi:hypothetical protein
MWSPFRNLSSEAALMPNGLELSGPAKLFIELKSSAGRIRRSEWLGGRLESL